MFDQHFEYLLYISLGFARFPNPHPLFVERNTTNTRWREISWCRKSVSRRSAIFGQVNPRAGLIASFNRGRWAVGLII